MLQKRNYQTELTELLSRMEGREKLLLHACCAPCSSYVLEYLDSYFDITLFFYNPNISPEEEYQKRYQELKRLVKEMGLQISVVEGKYDPECFYQMAKGMENLPEGGERCFLCYEMRMREAVAYAKENGFSYFTSTLSISPHKNAEKLNEIGERLAAEYKVNHLPSDFKKRGGYQRSIALSKEYHLYRQNFCGCVYSKTPDYSGSVSKF